MSSPMPAIPAGVMAQILDLARWAPSGDNTQPWRFEVVDAHHVVVHGFDTREHCVYDLKGGPSQMSLGALLENMAIAASSHGLGTVVQRRTKMPDTTPTFDVHFTPDVDLPADPLIAYITTRSVHRKPMRTRRLTAAEKESLEASVGPAHRIEWIDGLSSKWRVARLMFDNAKLRLTLPEAYRTHRDVIQWNARHSDDRVPDQALGVDPLTARLMQFVMQSWKRVEFFNRYLAGTVAPRIQMDFIPSLACGAHFVIKAKRRPTTIDDFVAAGRAMQRCWLTTTRLGLFQQPELTPLIFSMYVREGTTFTADTALASQARRLEARAGTVIGTDIEHAVWMGRIGAGTVPWARSLRRPLQQLMWSR